MPEPTDPPRPTLKSSVRQLIVSCTWTNNRVQDANGNQIYMWLNLTAEPGLTATVEWEAGTSSQGSPAVRAVIPSEIFTIIKDGTYSSSTGIVTHNGKDYSFMFVAGTNTAEVASYSL